MLLGRKLKTQAPFPNLGLLRACELAATARETPCKLQTDPIEVLFGRCRVAPAGTAGRYVANREPGGPEDRYDPFETTVFESARP